MANKINRQTHDIYVHGYQNKFRNSQEAFEYFYDFINRYGYEQSNTRSMFNVGFTITNPEEYNIDTPFRKWNPTYAEREWNWYLSGDQNANDIAKYAPIWNNMMDDKGNVNSNYGWHWQQNNQLDYVINELTNNPDSRRASISIYNAKDRYNFENDTPCTYAINFSITEDKLYMSVMMRSNDLWYGFCNDQYCFIQLQKLVAEKLNLQLGTYYHFANNLHIYNDKLNKN